MATSTQIQIRYHDNGVGFNPNKAKPGLGLSNIRSRVESLAGKIEVESGGANGTNYSINLPMSK
jgi:signal transduction histidine kinase